MDLYLERHFLENQRWLRDAHYGEFSEESCVRGQVQTRLIHRFDGQRYRRVLAGQQPHRRQWVVTRPHPTITALTCSATTHPMPTVQISERQVALSAR